MTTLKRLIWVFASLCLTAAWAEPATRAKPVASGDNALLQVSSPDWREQIIYFLMIDRFNDGDSSNNDQGAGVYDPSKESHYSGGDIPGITEKLDYIEALGATAVWLTPPVANQWWSSASEYAGYHGYWARHFKKVDEHYGSLADYQALSSALHYKGMYLIQDIVLNHTGIFFGYEGEYEPEQTDRNFVLYESGPQSAPEMPPFDMIDRLNPVHASAGIYNWTPGTDSYSDKEQQFTYQLGNLSDINTKNPRVLRAFKDAYRYWMDEVGVDAYRIDTVKYVEHEFWHAFLHDKDGIYAKATELGKNHFLTFGEVFESSPPYSDAGEKVVTSFLGTKDRPELNSVIGFPLYFEINRVFAEGHPTQQLLYRLQQFMQHYPNPHVTPNFIDNHDTKRFLSAASDSAMRQALALIFTIPGIPVIYQGTEQSLTETRQAMFAGGFASAQSQFRQDSAMYRYIQRLSQLRLSDKLYTHGDLTTLGANPSGPGLLAFKREYQGESALILMNSADHQILVNRLETGYPAGMAFTFRLESHPGAVSVPLTGADGRLTMVMPARSVMVLTPDNEQQQPQPQQHHAAPQISWEQDVSGRLFTQDVHLAGRSSVANMPLQLVINGNVDKAMPVQSDASGRWQVTVPVRDLGTTDYDIVVYAPEWQVASESLQFTGLVTEPDISVMINDSATDARGPQGTYKAPEQSASQGQMEITAVQAQAAGANLHLTFTMASVTDVWAPANGFDNVSFTLFFDLPGENNRKEGMQILPRLSAFMPENRYWELAHVAYGWGNYMYRAEGASAVEPGEMTGVSPKVRVDRDKRQITFRYPGAALGISDWTGVTVFATTWDIAGEGYYRDISPEGGEWTFGGGEEHTPKIMDHVMLVLKGEVP